MQNILKDLVEKLDLKANQFSDLVWYSCEDIAFCVIKEYPQNVLKRMKVLGDERYVAHIRFGVKRDGSNNKFPVTIICHLAYHDIKDTKEYFLENWKFIKRRFFAPMNIRVYDEYFLDTEDKLFYRLKKGKYIPIDLIEILNNVFKSHIKTYFYIRPTYYFLKNHFVRLLISIFQFVQLIIRLILWVIFGVSYKYDYMMEKHFKRYDKYSQQNGIPDKSIPAKRIPFFGFDVSKEKLFRFILLQIILYILLNKYFDNVVQLQNISSSMVVFLFYIIFALIVYEDIIPFFIKLIIKFISFIIYKLQLNR